MIFVFLNGIWTLNGWVAARRWFILDSDQEISYGLTSRVRFVRPESNLPVTIVTKYGSLELKKTFVQFIAFDNFFKVPLVNACLLLWNMISIYRISIKNSNTYPKHRQIHFLRRTLTLDKKRSLSLELQPFFFYPTFLSFGIGLQLWLSWLSSSVGCHSTPKG